jgi:DNA-binding CsgD family transcriptional regulator/tetratricopeptide (TPR) repeat protein
MNASRSPGALLGRRDECQALADLLRGVRAGHSAAIVLNGEAGIGKTALLEYTAGAASGCRVLRLVGVESEMELAFAGLHQLCAPLMDRLDVLPAPQAQALGIVFGQRGGSPPDRLLIGLAVLSLLSEAGGEQSLVCLIDDAQWLDQASLQTLAFVARRLAAESVAMVFATRTGGNDPIWARLPMLRIEGLTEPDATAVLEAAVGTPLDRRVRDRILAETRGNPLALSELPRWHSPMEMTFGPELIGTRTLTGRIEDGFRRQLEDLPEDTRRLMCTAAAEPLGDVGLLSRAAEHLGIGMGSFAPAEASDLIELGGTVRFRHPMIRSVAYWSTSLHQRQQAHRALADVTDPDQDPDRLAWHSAHAAVGPDEVVAASLERSADRALAQGGLSAAAAFLKGAAALSPDAADGARRRLSAAQALAHAGSFDAALDLLALAENGPLSDLQRAQVGVLHARIGFASNRGNEALPLLLAAAHELEPLDVDLALNSYVDALTAAVFAGRLASGTSSLEVAQAAKKAPSPDRPRRGDVLIQGVAALQVDGLAVAVPLLRRAVQEFDSDELSLEEGVRFLWLATMGAIFLWDLEAWKRLVDRHLQMVRDSGALSALPLALDTHVYADLFAGDIEAASTLVEEGLALTEVVEGPDLTSYGAIGLAAFRGREQDAVPLLAAALADVTARGEGIGVSMVSWAQAVLRNGLGQHAAALEAAQVAVANPPEPGGTSWALVELIEAAVRSGEPATATSAYAQLREQAEASDTDWAWGVVARSAALLGDGESADDHYQESIARLERAGMRVDLARTRLLYGEALRRAGRRRPAREQLREAHVSLEAMGMEAFAERARQELGATGETVRKRSTATHHELTSQELHIARLAAQGRTNPEIGAVLFISPHTVEWHLRKVFNKLGIRSRLQIGSSLAEDTRAPAAPEV